jgi:hypothetical protein
VSFERPLRAAARDEHKHTAQFFQSMPPNVTITDSLLSEFQIIRFTIKVRKERFKAHLTVCLKLQKIK